MSVVQRRDNKPPTANILMAHTVRPPSADRLTECDIILAAGGGYKARVSDSIFPTEWYPRAAPEYIVKWRNSDAQKRGTWVRVDIQGRPMVTTIKRTKSFIDESRAARCARQLARLTGLLARLADPEGSPEELLRRSVSLSRLDQGSGDLIRVVQSGVASERGRRSRGRSGGRSPAGREAGAPSSTKEV